MAETRTLKDVSVSSDENAITVHSWNSINNIGISESFPHREWSMEITFTRKSLPIKVGDKVRLRDEDSTLGEVIAFKGDNGFLVPPVWAWVSWAPFIAPSTVLVANLKHADV